MRRETRAICGLSMMLVTAIVVGCSSQGASPAASGVAVDFEGNVYGADFLMDVRKFVKK